MFSLVTICHFLWVSVQVLSFVASGLQCLFCFCSACSPMSAQEAPWWVPSFDTGIYWTLKQKKTTCASMKQGHTSRFRKLICGTRVVISTEAAMTTSWHVDGVSYTLEEITSWAGGQETWPSQAVMMTNQWRRGRAAMLMGWGDACPRQPRRHCDSDRPPCLPKHTTQNENQKWRRHQPVPLWIFVMRSRSSIFVVLKYASFSSSLNILGSSTNASRQCSLMEGRGTMCSATSDLSYLQTERKNEWCVSPNNCVFFSAGNEGTTNRCDWSISVFNFKHEFASEWLNWNKAVFQHACSSRAERGSVCCNNDTGDSLKPLRFQPRWIRRNTNCGGIPSGLDCTDWKHITWIRCCWKHNNPESKFVKTPQEHQRFGGNCRNSFFLLFFRKYLGRFVFVEDGKYQPEKPFIHHLVISLCSHVWNTNSKLVHLKEVL